MNIRFPFIKWDATIYKWRVTVNVNGVNHAVGEFTTMAECRKAREEFVNNLTDEERKNTCF